MEIRTIVRCNDMILMCGFQCVPSGVIAPVWALPSTVFLIAECPCRTTKTFLFVLTAHPLAIAVYLGHGLVEGWVQGVLQMREGERAHLHVPGAELSMFAEIFTEV